MKSLKLRNPLKKVSREFSLILILAIIAGLLILFVRESHFYNPMNITIDMKGDTVDQGKLYFDTGSGFKDKNVITKFFSAQPSFTRMFFRIETPGVKNIKINPAINSKTIQIREISLQTGKYRLSWRPDEILRDFTLVGLNCVDSTNREVLLLQPTSHKRGMLVLKTWLPAVVTQKDTRTQKALILMILLVFIVISTIISRRPAWFYLQTGRIYRGVTSFFKVSLFGKNKIFLWLICLGFLFKIFLRLQLAVNVTGNSPHDDAHYILQSYYLATGYWLGPYDGYTLIKGIGFPLFIAFSSFFGIPLFLMQHLLYGIGCLLFVHACSGLFQKDWIRILVYFILLFNPMTTSGLTQSVGREPLHSALEIIIVAGYIGLYATRHGKIIQTLRWSMVTSIMLAFYWHVREEGVLLIPLIVLLTILIFISFFGKERKDFVQSGLSVTGNYKRIKVILFISPLIFVVMGNLMVASVNKIRYGEFVVNEMKSSAFTKTSAALSRIRTEKWGPYVPIPKDVREKAYKVSPAFAQLRNYLESAHNGWKKFGPGDTTELKGGWFMWALRDAAIKAGYHNSLRQSVQFYEQIAREINQALKAGKLAESDKLTFFEFSWDQKLSSPLLSTIPETVVYLATFRGYNVSQGSSTGSVSDLALFQKMTSTKVRFPGYKDDLNMPIFDFKLRLLSGIAGIYQLLNPVFLLISLIGFILLVLSPRRYYGSFPKVFIVFLLSGLIYFISIRIFLISYISVCQWPAISIKYLFQVYPFLLIFEVLGIFSLILIISSYLKRKRRNGRMAT